MRVDIEKVKEYLEFKKSVNSVELYEIKWYENGEEIKFDPEMIEEFIFCGLNNIDFISTGYYKEKK